MKLLVYMPVYNEQDNIKDAIDAIPREYKGIDSMEILVVDDGSTDNSAKLAKEAGATVISHGSNKKLGVAFRTALQYAKENRYDILVSIDADRQFNANQIRDMIEPILDDRADMVTGNRFSKGMPKNMSKMKYWGNKQMSRLISIITGQKFTDVSCGFRAYSKEALLRLNLFGKFTYTQETIMDLLQKDIRVIEFPVDIKYFKERKSKIANSIFKYAFKTTKIILRTFRDYKPLLFFGGSGLISMVTGLIFLAGMFIHYFTTGSFTPYKFLGFIALGFLIFGLLLVIVGLLADMLNRMRINQERILYELNKEKYDK
jgi:glycosyltransferase involved in cell wall biosynthesis